MLVTCCLLHPGHIQTLYRTLWHLQLWKVRRLKMFIFLLETLLFLLHWPLYCHISVSLTTFLFSSKLNSTLVNIQKTSNNTNNIIKKPWNGEGHGCSLPPTPPQITPDPSHLISCFLHLIDEIFTIGFIMNKEIWPLANIFFNRVLFDTQNTFSFGVVLHSTDICV